MTIKKYSDEPVDLRKVYGTPHSFGYQRRPDLDTSSGLAWEGPMGQVIISPRNEGEPTFVRLTTLAKRLAP